MRKVLLSFILNLCFNVGNSSIISDSAKTINRSAIKFYPLQLLSGEIRISYEQPLGKNVSAELGIGYLYGIIDGELDGDFGPEGKLGIDDVNGFAIRSGVRIYSASTKEHRSLYFNPQFLFKYAHSGYTPIYPSYKFIITDAKMYSVQILLGYNFYIRNRVIFNPYLGAGLKEALEGHEITARYFTVHLGFSIGYYL